MSRTVTKQELVDRLSNGIGLTKQEVHAVVDGFLALVMESVSAGERVELRRFGVWKCARRKSRTVKTPNVEQKIALPDRTVAVFTPADEFRERMAQGGCVES
jgi:integration host factor subunit beta